MCTIKNEFSEQLLKDLRRLDKGEINFSTDKADILARVAWMRDALEDYESILKKELKETLKETVYVPSIEKKVSLVEGRATTVFDNKKVIDMVGVETYVLISSVQKGKMEEILGDEAKKVIANASETKIGEPSISVRGMNKKELLEHKK